MDLYIKHDITDLTVYEVAESFKNYKRGEDINIYIDSLGGYIDSAQLIAEMLVEARNAGSKIVCRNIGDVCSAATIIWLVGNEKIFDMAKGEFLIHQPYVDNVSGNSDELLTAVIDLTKTEDQLADLYSVMSGKDKEEILARMKQELPMTWKELFEYKFANEVETDVL